MKTEQTTPRNSAEILNPTPFDNKFVEASQDYLTDIQTLAMDSWSKSEFQELNNLAHSALRSMPRNTNEKIGSLRPYLTSKVRIWVTSISKHYVDCFLCIQLLGDEETRGVPYYLPKVTKLHQIDVAMYPTTLHDGLEGCPSFYMTKLEVGTFAVVPVPLRLYFDTGRVSIRPIRGDTKTGIGHKSKDELFDILFACLATLKSTRYVLRNRRKLYDLVRVAALCTGFTHVLTSTEVGSERAQWASIFDTLLFHRLMELDWAVEILHSQSTSH